MLLTAKGKLCADVFVWIDGESLIVEADVSLEESLPARLERYAVADDVAFELLAPAAERCHVFGSVSGGRDGLQIRRLGVEGVDVASLPNDLREAGADEVELLRIERGLPLGQSFPRTRCLRKLASIKSRLILTKVATLDRRSSRGSIASDESIVIFADLSGTAILRLPQQPLSWIRVAEIRTPHQREVPS